MIFTACTSETTNVNNNNPQGAEAVKSSQFDLQHKERDPLTRPKSYRSRPLRDLQSYFFMLPSALNWER